MQMFKHISNILRKTQKKICHKNNLRDFLASEAASELINSLNNTTPRINSLNFIETLSLKIAQLSDSEYTVIARLKKDNTFNIEVIASPEKILKTDTFAFETKLLPTLLSDGYIHSQEPDEILKQTNEKKHKAKSVSGLLLRDKDNNPVGAVFAFSRSKNSEAIVANTLRFFSFNLVSELINLNSKEKLENKKREFLRTEEELKLKNQLLDNLNRNISKAKQVVDESSRLKSAFLANLSHEIRTPMNVIMGFTELLSADNMTNDQRRNYIDIIQQNGTRLLHIMDSLIDISRFQAKNIGKDQQAFSLNQMMQQLYNNFQSNINASGKPLNLNLILDSSEEDIVILDKEATYKVLNHLLDNAIKFTASGFVNFGCKKRDKEILFFVEDSGVGIPEGKEDEIFDLFRQGDLRLSRQFGGTGLGLAIAKRYVTAMNGKIWCNNKNNPERGAEFNFTLPYRTNKTDDNPPEPSSREASPSFFSAINS